MNTTILAISSILTILSLGCGSADESREGTAQASLSSNAPVTCTIQTNSGHYLTAVGGGGRVSDAIHSDATQAKAWEKFTLVDSGDGSSPINYGIKTVKGYYLTAMGGGGRITDVIHSNATQLQAWEKFALHSLGGGVYAIKTINGRYLTATGGGGNIADVIHSDATRVNAWEKFRFKCSNR
jgi:hypothetical protein